MKHPIRLTIEKEYPDVKLTHKAPINCVYRIPYAEATCWKNNDFAIVLQDYDGKDAYLSLIEIKTKEKLSFIMNTNTTDLFWYYQLKGAIEINQHSTRSEPDDSLVQMKEEEYALFYSPPQQYQVTLAPGHHLFFFFVVDASWLQRHPVSEVTHYQKLIKLLKHKTATYRGTNVLKIHSAVRAEIYRLFTMPNFEEMEMDVKVYSPIVRLISISREDLQDKRKSLSQNARETLIQIRSYIDEQILQGAPPPITEIVQHFKMSIQQLRLDHRRVYGYSLQSYITRKRLQAIETELLNTDKRITDIAYTFGYELNAFQKQFRIYYHLSPSEFRKRYKKH